MSRVIFGLGILFLAFGLCLSGCSKSQGNDDMEMLTEEEKQQIVADYAIIDDDVSPYFDPTNFRPEELDQLAENIKEMPSVENAWVENNTLAVRFKKGGLVMWGLPQEYEIPPFVDMNDFAEESRATGLRAATGAKIFPGNKKVAILNVLGEDVESSAERYFSAIALATKLKFIQKGYDAEVIPAEECTVDFFKTELNKYGVIILATHGVTMENQIWFTTGDKPLSSSLAKPLVNAFSFSKYELWRTDQIAIGKTPFTINGERNAETSKESIIISDKFIDLNYNSTDKKFPNTLFCTISCHGMDRNMQLGRMLKTKGVGVTIGYDHTNTMGRELVRYFFSSLLSGYSTSEAYNTLPTEIVNNKVKDDEGVITHTAHLVYFPNENEGGSGWDMSLIESDDRPCAEIGLNNYVDFMSVADRVFNVSGKLLNITPRVVNITAITVNGFSSALNVSEDGTFNQDVLLVRSDDNLIRLYISGFDDAGMPFTASREMHIDGSQLEPLDLFTEMRWNTNYTDVDLHLIGPDGEHCFYGNTHASWGGILDVDDVDGYGPEHITISSFREEGIYTLHAHYFDPRGYGSSNVWVDVITNEYPYHFGPYELSYGGESWEVCTIEIPSGKVTSITNNTTRSTNRLFQNLPQKQ